MTLVPNTQVVVVDAEGGTRKGVHAPSIEDGLYEAEGDYTTPPL